MRTVFWLKCALILSLMVGAGGIYAGEQPSASGSIASISQPEGMVLVNQGKYYLAARPGQKLNVGDRIMTMDGARALVVFNDGCTQQLNPNNKLVLKSVADCSLKTAKIESVGPHYAALGDLPPVGGAGGGVGGGLALLGGVGIASVMFLVNNNNNNNDNPVSQQ